MATVTQLNDANGKGFKVYELTADADETERLPLLRGESCLIHVENLTADSVMVNVYTNGSNPAPAEFNGATSFTADFARGFTAPGKCSITVKKTGAADTVTVTFTK